MRIVLVLLGQSRNIERINLRSCPGHTPDRPLGPDRIEV
jgi:hypothetical protein